MLAMLLGQNAGQSTRAVLHVASPEFQHHLQKNVPKLFNVHMNMSASVRTGRACLTVQFVLWNLRVRYVPRRSYSYVENFVVRFSGL